MSEVISLAATAFVMRIALPTGARLLHTVIDGLSETRQIPSKGTSKVVSRVPQREILEVPSVASIRSNFGPLPSFSDSVRSSAAKAEYITALAKRPFLSSDTRTLTQKVRAFEASTGLWKVEAARADLEACVENEHHRLFTSGVETTCQRASIRIGFDRIETLASPIGSTIKRFSASDQLGRTIVTEIDTAKDRDIRIDSEVLGVRDNTCHQILDDFHQALKDEGLIIGGVPKRKATGGWCSLAGAKLFETRRQESDAPNAQQRAAIPAAPAPLKTKKKLRPRSQRAILRAGTKSS